MHQGRPYQLRQATPGDTESLIALWGMLFEEPEQSNTSWRSAAREWFSTYVDDTGATATADRVDLSATPDGGRLYEQLGFVNTSAPRMKLVL